MKPGRELDKLIAEKLLGWRKRPDGEYVDAAGHILPADFIPRYSTEISAAWEVVEETKLLLGNYLTMHRGRNGDEWIVFPDGGGAAITIDYTCNTAPHAICIAALIEEKFLE